MSDLFAKQEQKRVHSAKPLAVRMRPTSLDDFTGQLHFLGPDKLLRRLLKADRLQSLIFYGPPGTGKTTLAEVISHETHAHFVSVNAASIGVKEIRQEIQQAKDRLATGGERTILFVDELHHFSKTQQDVLLPEMENGVISLIGATTSNPFFALNSALISRSQVFEFHPHTTDDILGLLRRAMKDPNKGLGNLNVDVTEDAMNFFAEICDGDARRALNGLEIAVRSVADTGAAQSVSDESKPNSAIVDLSVAEESIQKKAIRYDNQGDEHYDAASALIKSIRGSDPDAAIYWLARMLEAGEDPRFVARRVMISAAEDIGNADPFALTHAVAAARATETIGMPECRIPLAQAVTYLACTEKSNRAYLAVNQAMDDVRNRRLLPVPVHLKDAHYAGAKQLEHGDGYQYPHNDAGGWVPQDYLGIEREYYQPTSRGKEQEFAQRLAEFRRLRSESMEETGSES